MSAPSPDLKAFYFDDCGILLFAPANLADEVQATRDVLAEAETWGDVIKALPRHRLDELRACMLPKAESLPDEDEPLDVPDDWPSLRYAEMASWLPESVAERFGTRYDGRLDSGTSFDVEDWAELEEALEELGVSVQDAPMSLEELFD